MLNRVRQQRSKRVHSMSSGQGANVSAMPASSLPGVPEQAEVGQGLDRSAGELLRSAREAAGLHIAALAVMLKVPVKKLEALEASRFDLLPDMVFARALASSVCRTLKIDSAPVLERLPQIGTPLLVYQGGNINAPFRPPGNSAGPSKWSGMPKPAVAAVLLLLLASAALLFWPSVSKQVNLLTSTITSRISADKSTGNTAAVSIETATAVSAATATAVSAETATAVSAELGLRGERSLAGVLPPSLIASDLPSQPVSAQGTAPVTPLVGQATSAASAPLLEVPENSIIVFRAIGESWVEVTDAKRQTVLRRTLAAGESVGVTGALPLAATVGRASMTKVDVRGQGFDLGPWSKDNVARFEVK